MPLRNLKINVKNVEDKVVIVFDKSRNTFFLKHINDLANLAEFNGGSF